MGRAGGKTTLSLARRVEALWGTRETGRDQRAESPEVARAWLPWSGGYLVALRVRFTGERQQRGLMR